MCLEGWSFATFPCFSNHSDHVVGLSGIVLPKQVQHQKRVCNRGNEEGGGQNTFASSKNKIVSPKASIFKTEAPEDFGSGKFVKYQMCLWDLIEKPETSRAAEVISNISIIFVVISTVGMVMATMPELEPQYPKLALIEAVCISWFTIEYLLRFGDTKIFRI